jgi:hypothetical protein
VSLTNRNKIIPAGLIITAFVVWIGVKQYRNHVRCAARNAAFRQQVEKLKNDARDQLRIGTPKDQIVRFFEHHAMRLTFDRGGASGTFQTTGCPPFGCGADTAMVGVSVIIDSRGTVSGEPHVWGIYTDCL